ncbi:MAG: DUF4349 domain-containing protein [Chloroflexota bacterium]
MRHIAFVSAALLGVTLTACSSAAPLSRDPGRGGEASAQDKSVASEARLDAPPVSKASATAARPAPAAAPAQAGGSIAAVTLPNFDRMIIRTVTLTLAVEHVAQTYQQVEIIAESLGGSVTSSTVKEEGDRTSASVVLRVPSDQRTYISALDQLRKLAISIPDESLASQDVTEEFVDLESAMRALQATETRLLSLMERAQKVDEVIAVQRELTNVRGQIEKIEGRRRFLERRSEFTTINLTLRDVAAARQNQQREWSPRSTFEEALGALGRSLQGVARAGIWAAVWLPVYGIPLVGGWWSLRQIRRRRQVARI